MKGDQQGRAAASNLPITDALGLGALGGRNHRLTAIDDAATPVDTLVSGGKNLSRLSRRHLRRFGLPAVERAHDEQPNYGQRQTKE
jgi:hypothetical protein